MASGFKNPPSFGDGTANYETWRNELDMWCLVTDVKIEKQALAVALSLQGQARAIALELDKTKCCRWHRIFTRGLRSCF